MGKLTRPGAVCAQCKTGHDIRQLGAKCHWPVRKNRRCGGPIIAALSVDDWIECRSCWASGYEENSEPCVQCDGCGWIFIRDMPSALKERVLQQAALDERKRKTK